MCFSHIDLSESHGRADIVHIIHGSRGRLDWDRILKVVGEHWCIVLWALVLFHYTYPAHSNYIPHRVWDDLLGKLRFELENPNQRAHFRGSLLDENMFAIDVHEWGMANLIEDLRSVRDNKIPPELENPDKNAPQLGEQVA